MAETNHFEENNDLIEISSPLSQGQYMPVVYSESELNNQLERLRKIGDEKLLKKEEEITNTLAQFELERESFQAQMLELAQSLGIARVVTEELYNIFISWKKSKEAELQEISKQNLILKKESDQALEDLRSVESAFADLHRRYEQTKTVVETLKENEERLKNQLKEGQTKLQQQEKMFALLRDRTEEKLIGANQEIENTKKNGEAELAALRAQLKKAEMKLSSLEKNMEQKVKENQELSNICDELIAKVGRS